MPIVVIGEPYHLMWAHRSSHDLICLLSLCFSVSQLMENRLRLADTECLQLNLLLLFRVLSFVKEVGGQGYVQGDSLTDRVILIWFTFHRLVALLSLFLILGLCIFFSLSLYSVLWRGRMAISLIATYVCVRMCEPHWESIILLLLAESIIVGFSGRCYFLTVSAPLVTGFRQTPTNITMAHIWDQTVSWKNREWRVSREWRKSRLAEHTQENLQDKWWINLCHQENQESRMVLGIKQLYKLLPHTNL